jgi:hypothetical protein
MGMHELALPAPTRRSAPAVLCRLLLPILCRLHIASAVAGKWVCTGTPVGTSIEDLLGQFSALQLQPYDKKTW